jgi:hypothetical protein
MSELLKFGKGNAKLGKNVYTFSIPAGHTCPFANECLSKADKETGKLTDGPKNQFRCFSATAENQYPNVRIHRWHNFNLLKKHGETMFSLAKIINDSIPDKAKIIRIHVSGDFYSQMYFDAWAYVASLRTDILFYFYTKSLKYWAKRLDVLSNGKRPSYLHSNFVGTASRGGKDDKLISQYDFREATVVFSEEEAKEKNLEIDHDDSHAMKFGDSFALVLHGTQAKGTTAAKALQALKKKGITGYSRKSIPLTTVGA